MTVSYADSNRRDALRSAALFVIDEDRQSTGYDKRARGSADVPDVVRVFDEMLAMFPLESEVGDAIESDDELPCWRSVLRAMGPIWMLWPEYSAYPDRLIGTSEWRGLRDAVRECVDRHGLWLEEVAFPVNVVSEGRAIRVGSWRELKRFDRALLEMAIVGRRRGPHHRDRHRAGTEDSTGRPSDTEDRMNWSCK